MVEFGKVWKRMQALHGCIVCIYSIYKDAPACTSILRYICAMDVEDFCSGSHEPSLTFRNQQQSSPTIHYQHTNSNLSKCWGQCKQCKGRVAVLVRYQIPVTHITCQAGVCDVCSWCCLLRKKAILLMPAQSISIDDALAPLPKTTWRPQMIPRYTGSAQLSETVGMWRSQASLGHQGWQFGSTLGSQWLKTIGLGVSHCRFSKKMVI